MSEEKAHNLIHAIVSASHAAYCLRNIKHVSPVRSQREQNQFKKIIKSLTDDLVAYEHELQKLDNAQEQSTEDVYNYFYEFLEETNKVRLDNSEEVRRLLIAYRKSPDSINGIVNKIL